MEIGILLKIFHHKAHKGHKDKKDFTLQIFEFFVFFVVKIKLCVSLTLNKGAMPSDRPPHN